MRCAVCYEMCGTVRWGMLRDVRYWDIGCAMRCALEPTNVELKVAPGTTMSVPDMAQQGRRQIPLST
eukprot:1543513-Rhodomonas_salina.3